MRHQGIPLPQVDGAGGEGTLPPVQQKLPESYLDRRQVSVLGVDHGQRAAAVPSGNVKDRQHSGFEFSF
ncbi:uncharacterized protein METZ01_LOCUS285699, partial [marine metagenome]